MPAFDVQYVAHLARLQLTPEEQDLFGQQLSQILHHLDRLNQVDISQVEPTAHAMALVNVFRPDQPQPCLPHGEVLRPAPKTANGLFLVPKIVE